MNCRAVLKLPQQAAEMRSFLDSTPHFNRVRTILFETPAATVDADNNPLLVVFDLTHQLSGRSSKSAQP